MSANRLLRIAFVVVSFFNFMLVRSEAQTISLATHLSGVIKINGTKYDVSDTQPLVRVGKQVPDITFDLSVGTEKIEATVRFDELSDDGRLAVTELVLLGSDEISGPYEPDEEQNLRVESGALHGTAVFAKTSTDSTSSGFVLRFSGE